MGTALIQGLPWNDLTIKEGQRADKTSTRCKTIYDLRQVFHNPFQVTSTLEKYKIPDSIPKGLLKCK